MVTSLELVTKFARSRLIDVSLEDEEILANESSWVQDEIAKAKQKLGSGGIKEFNDRWAAEYAKDLIQFLDERGWVIVQDGDR